MTFTNPYAGARLLPAVGLALLLAGCASTGNPRDPLEGYNRAAFRFNDAIDRAVFKPTATMYRNVAPSFIQTGIGNFFGNLSDVWSSANNFAQLKGRDGLNDFMRFAVNSTLGLAGVLDIATPAGLRKHNEDLGQTLGYWGVPAGPYLVLPLLGPSTLRDTAALPGDMWGDPWRHVDDIPWRNGGIALRAVDQRAGLLQASNLLEDAALDRYEFVRDAYLQRRSSRTLDTDTSKTRATRVRSELDTVLEKLGMKPRRLDDDGAADTNSPSTGPARE